MNRWASFPRWAAEELTAFVAGSNAGTHMAAIRIYLALALESDFSTRVSAVSWTTLQAITGLSRPMITRGIAAAEEAGLIVVDRASGTHSYRLLRRGDETTFTKVPAAQLRGALPHLPTRGFHALDALKVYVALLTVRARNLDKAFIGHKKLATRSGVQPRRVRAAIDVLINHRLVHVMQSESTEAGHPYNEYQLLGFRGAEATAISSSPEVASPNVITVAPAPSFLNLPGSASDDVPF